MNKRTVITVTIVVLLAAGGLAYAFRGLFLKAISPEAYLAAVFLNTTTSLGRELLELPNAAVIKNAPYEYTLTAGLKNYKLGFLAEDLEYTLETLKLITFTSASKVDIAGRKLSNNIEAFMGGASVIDFEVFASDDVYAVSCAKLTDKTVTVNPRTFVSDWNSSAMFTGLTGETLPDNAINADELNSLIFSDKTILRETDKNTITRLINETVSFITSPQSITLGEKSGEYTTAQAVYGKDALNALYTSYTEALIAAVDERITPFIDTIANSEIADEYIEYTAAVEVFRARARGYKITEDLTVDLYIDDKDLIRKVIISGPNKASVEIILGEPGDVSGKLSDYIEVTSGDVSIISSLKGSSKNNLRQNLVIKVTDGTYIDYTAVWSPNEDGVYEISCVFGAASGETADFSLKGNLTAGDGFVQLKNGSLRAAYNGDFIELKTDYSLKAYNGEIGYNSGNAKSLFNMTAFELGAISMKAMELLYSFN